MKGVLKAKIGHLTNISHTKYHKIRKLGIWERVYVEFLKIWKACDNQQHQLR
ncbi:hypothetical protein Sjap_012999 [Stephania japonica]|uniref:Uncharacterized protein n=1 Tax=Stephania japonica TaxID=461633 RepID=A0AAP0NXA8_9MAGN